VVIEAIHDHAEDKKDLLARLHEVCSEETVLVTNTSTLSITELATACGRPDRVIGMHFMYPMSWSPIVEVVRGMDTSDETFVRAQALARQLGKRVVQVYDSPGYVTTRGILPLLNEAIHMVMEGVASVEDIDKAMRLGYEFRMGPLEYCDRVGLDKVIGWMDHLFQEFGDSKYRPCPLLKKMVRAGHWGRRSGQGFYDWDGGQIVGSRQGEL